MARRRLWPNHANDHPVETAFSRQSFARNWLCISKQSVCLPLSIWRACTSGTHMHRGGYSVPTRKRNWNSNSLTCCLSRFSTTYRSGSDQRITSSPNERPTREKTYRTSFSGIFNPGTKTERWIAVGELKTPGTDLDAPQSRYPYETPVEQAFRYARHQPGVEWVIVSDMDEIRLYRNGYVDAYHV